MKNLIRFLKKSRSTNQFLLSMKIFTFLLLVCIIPATAGKVYSQDKKITLKEKGISLGNLFQKIEEVSEYRFLYGTTGFTDLSQKVNVNAQDEKLSSVLNSVFANVGIKYTLVGNNLIVISPTLEQTQLKVSGKVTDPSGQPLSGVTVSIKGTTKAVISNENGNYTITLSGKEDVLVFTFIGMKRQEINVDGKSLINVMLENESIGLNEIVVVGYGKQSRKDVTGAISSINEKTLREVPVTNAQQLLEGRVAGVYVTQSSNKPGSQPTILIRGNRSITANNDPLYVIDGIPTSDGFNDIDPNQITSMEVLKDASATAIYGSRGANGVILITTARGKERKDGQPEVRYNTYFGVTKVTKYADIFNGPEFVTFKRDANRAINNYNDADPAGSDAKIFTPYELQAIQNNQYTDWQRLITQDGFTQNHDLSILGASKNTKYNLSLGYFDDKGYFKLQDYKRYNLRVNLDQKIGNHVSAGISMMGSYSERNGGSINPYYGMVIQNPIGTPYDASGNLSPFPTGDPLMYNPLSNFVPGNMIDLEKRVRILSSIYAEAEIMEGLKFRVNFGPDLTNSRSGSFAASNTTSQQGALPSASNSSDYIFSYTLENILTYDKQFGKHKIGFTGLYSVQERTEEASSASVKDLPVSSVTYFNLASANTITGVGSNYSRWDILSYMGRLNYSFDSRYLLTLTGRADGSSRFAPGHKWGFFPSAAFAYNIYNEHFLKSLTFLNNLKIRVSYGKTGNTALSPYGTQGLLGTTSYDFDGISAFGRYPNTIANPNLKWETTGSFNLGIDFGLFKNRISGSIEGYRSKTSDLLLPYVLPNTTGFSSVTTNIGSTQNTGFELTLSTKNIISENNGFQWSSDFTTAYNKEEILELSQGKVDDIGNTRFIGQPVHVYYDYQKTGIWQTGEDAQAVQYSSAVGQIKIADRNGNGKIDPEDRMIIGSPTPKWTFGFNNRLSFKNFDVAIFMVGVTGNTIVSAFNSVPNNTIALGGRYNMLNVDYWTKNNPTNAYPQPINGQSGSPGPVFGSTLKYFDGSYLRIRNINFGYNLPANWIKKIKAQSIRAYFNITNPYIFSSYVHKYHGIDPVITDSPAFVNYLLGFNIAF